MLCWYYLWAKSYALLWIWPFTGHLGIQTPFPTQTSQEWIKCSLVDEYAFKAWAPLYIIWLDAFKVWATFDMWWDCKEEDSITWIWKRSNYKFQVACNNALKRIVFMTHGKLTSTGLVDEYALKAWATFDMWIDALEAWAPFAMSIDAFKAWAPFIMLINAFKAWAPHSMIWCF